MARTKLWTVAGGAAAVAAIGALALSATAVEARRPPRELITALAVNSGPAVFPSPAAAGPAVPATSPAEPAPVMTLPNLPAMALTDGFESLPAGLGWADGSVHASWMSRFNGYGAVGIAVDGSNVLSMSPRPAALAGATHAALVTSTLPLFDAHFAVDARTVRQLRTGTPPNPWETAWVLWNYAGNTHFYYVALKTNGWEIGKADPAYPGAQRFLATGSDRTFAPGDWHSVRVEQTGATFTVAVDGQVLAAFTDHERPYTSGLVGLYCEDSEVQFDNFSAAP